jgi:hypothetical protein
MVFNFSQNCVKYIFRNAEPPPKIDVVQLVDKIYPRSDSPRPRKSHDNSKILLFVLIQVLKKTSIFLKNSQIWYFTINKPTIEQLQWSIFFKNPLELASVYPVVQFYQRLQVVDKFI